MLRTLRPLLLCLWFFAAVDYCAADSSSPVTSPAYALWNSFLEMNNVLEVANTSPWTNQVTVTIYDITGQPGSVQGMTLQAGQQIDLPLSWFPTFVPGSYGVIQIDFTASINARLSYYRQPAAAVGGDAYEFAFAVPVANALNGSSYVSYNTFQPSRSAVDAANQVQNWLSVVNLSSAAKTFTIRRYGYEGEPQGEYQVDVPGFGRQDVDGGHGQGPDAVGYNAIIPADEAAPYLAQLIRYGADAPAGYTPPSFSFAFPLTARAGGPTEQWVSISAGAQAENWLEIVNVSDEAESVEVTLFNNAGVAVHTVTLGLAARAQRHLLASVPLAGASGAARIVSTRAGTVLGQSMFYFRDAVTNRIRAMYGTQLASLNNKTHHVGSWNRFLNMYNWLRVFNTAETAVDCTLTTYFGAEQIGQVPVSLPALAGTDLGLHETVPYGTQLDQYGVVDLECPGVMAELLRIRPDGAGGIDFAMPTTVINSDGGPGGGNDPLLFDFTSAVALTLSESNEASAVSAAGRPGTRSGQSNMRKVLRDGEMREVLLSGVANIASFVIGPNHKVYVVLRPEYLGYRPLDCLLAEVAVETGETTCIDDDAYMIDWQSGSREAIQFDAEGNIYYRARVAYRETNWAERTVLRRYKQGTRTELLSEGSLIIDFAVAPEGDVFINYATLDSQYAFNRITPTGEVHELQPGIETTFMRFFSDGNLYIGAACAYTPGEWCGIWGTYVYNMDTHTLDPRPYIGLTGAYNRADELCEEMEIEDNTFCNGMGLGDLAPTTSGGMYAIAGLSDYGYKAKVVKIFPTFSKVPTVIDNVLGLYSFENKLFISGRDTSNANMLTLFDTEEDEETVLVPPSTELVFMYVDYSPDENKVLFFADRYDHSIWIEGVLGEVNLATLAVTTHSVGNRMVDFKAFHE